MDFLWLTIVKSFKISYKKVVFDDRPVLFWYRLVSVPPGSIVTCFHHMRQTGYFHQPDRNDWFRCLHGWLALIFSHWMDYQRFTPPLFIWSEKFIQIGLVGSVFSDWGISFLRYEVLFWLLEHKGPNGQQLPDVNKVLIMHLWLR